MSHAIAAEVMFTGNPYLVNVRLHSKCDDQSVPLGDLQMSEDDWMVMSCMLQAGAAALVLAAHEIDDPAVAESVLEQQSNLAGFLADRGIELDPDGAYQFRAVSDRRPS
jgi:hypothetical protein